MKTLYPGIDIPFFMIVIKWLGHGPKCSYELSKELNINYKRIHSLKKTFIERGWVVIEEQENGKHNMILTDLGEQLVIKIKELFLLLNLDDEYIIEQLIEERRVKREVVDVEALKKIIGDLHDKD